MNYRQSILDVIGSKGKARQAFFYDCAHKAQSEQEKALLLLKANEFTQYRDSLIQQVYQGKYIELAMTSDDVVK